MITVFNFFGTEIKQNYNIAFYLWPLVFIVHENKW